MSLEYASDPLYTASRFDDLTKSIEELQRSFSIFKETNDDRLLALSQKKSEDVLSLEKLARLETQISKLSNKVSRPVLSGVSDLGHVTHEEKAALSNYVRSGDPSLLDAVELKNYNNISDTSGGFLAPGFLEARLDEKLNAMSPLRQLARKIEISQGGALNVVAPSSKVSAYWVNEGGARNATPSVTFDQETIPIHEIFSNPGATPQFLEDTAIDVESWIVSSFAEQFGRTEDESFVLGSGVGQPKGICSYSTRTQNSVAAKKVVVVKTQNASSLADDTFDFLINFAFGLASQYRTNATWLMNSSSLASLRRLKDADGNYAWQPSNILGQPSQLLGFPVYEEGNFADIANSNYPIAFGDFNAAYTIVTRRGMTILRDPYSNKPYVHFYATRRLGAGVVNFDAYRLVQVSA
jgi:HK97 family phage major capsid protein